MSKKIEVFTDGSARGVTLVEAVKRLACPKCEVVVHEGAGEDAEHSALSVRMDGKPIDVDKLLARS
ncbi:hypothetical protein FE782_05245 [Paenibacillus antri]|uniref:Uncharacterized protein n=1 Tax=Paenibacillus antri TaxID=2582848 RepID=A0A5R9GJQ1_9BACL|nr:hypothetical protein [Paenibacillus antri]TLS53678.1 hypothetical protein FE782_05245 [Paenibacillus antri]